MCVSGTHIAWGIATPALQHQQWLENTTTLDQVGVITSWYFGAIIGSIFLIWINDKMARKDLFVSTITFQVLIHRYTREEYKSNPSIQILAAGFYMISSILMIIFPDTAFMLLAARLLAGLGHGLAFIPGVIHGAENSANYNRPETSSLMQAALLPGLVFAPLLISLNHYDDLQPATYSENQILGALGTLFSAIAVILPMFLTLESVVTEAKRGNDSNALDNMARLRREPREGPHLQYDFLQIKAMLVEDKNQNVGPFQEGNSRAMFTVILARILLVLSLNYGINMLRVQWVNVFTTQSGSPSLSFGLRWLVFIVISWYADSIGRRVLLVVSGFSSAACLMGLVICSFVVAEGNSPAQGILSLIFDGAVGLGVLYIPDVLMGEAFPQNKKFASSIVACVIENLVQALIVGLLYQFPLREFELPFLITSTALFTLITAALLFMVPTIPPDSSLRSIRAAFRTKYN